VTHFRPRPALRISQLTAAGLAPLLLAASPVTANAAEGGASREPQAAIADQRSLAATPTSLREAASADADADGAEVDGGGDQHPTPSDEMGDMEGMDHTAPAGDPTDEPAITEHDEHGEPADESTTEEHGEHGEPADEPTTEEHGEHGEPAGPESTRPRAAVLGSFAAVNGGVLLAAGWMRRRTKERVQRSKSARAAALGKG